jgi:allophanate hydrolase
MVPVVGISPIAPAFHDERLVALATMWQHVEEARASGGVGPAHPPGERRVSLAVVGAHLTGQPLNRVLTDRDARLVRAARTAGVSSLRAGRPAPGRARTGLLRVDGRAGAWFLCEAHDDISRYGGWRAYLAGREKRDG